VWNHLDGLTEQLRAVNSVLLFTDFDGTLVPIQENPQQCYLQESVRDVIVELSQSARTRVGIITGRDLDDIRRRVALDDVAYAGNHGLEIAAPGWLFCEPTAESLASQLAKITATLDNAFAGIPGVWVQNKRLSASVHYRQAHPRVVPRVREMIAETIHQYQAQQQFHTRSGKMTLEIRPIVDWHKGSAISLLSQHWQADSQTSVTIYLGDDETDEDAFRSLANAITIHVGDSQTTFAKYSVSTPADVAQFLSWLANHAAET
jgi:trehalose 6-phosphate phosphatase